MRSICAPRWTLSKSSWFPAVHIRYTDGAEVSGTAEDWPRWRSDGVDEVRIGNPKETVFGGHSIYWLYWEERTGAPAGYWVAGAGTVGNVYNEIPSEVMFHASGEQWARPVKFMPDVSHAAVKLGWWRSGRPD